MVVVFSGIEVGVKERTLVRKNIVKKLYPNPIALSSA